MIITDKHTLKLYQQAGALSVKILGQLHRAVKPGVLPIKIDQLAEELCRKYRVRPAFKGVNPANPYQYSTCISINDVVVHGLPGRTKKIKPGDIVKVDFGLVYQGLYTDHCFTVIVSPATKAKVKLVAAAKDTVLQAIPLAVSGNHVGDLGAVMQQRAKVDGFDVLKQYTGHSIGRTLHDLPAVPAFGSKVDGPKLEKGMVLCLESQVVAGSDQVKVAEDGWSVQTRDGGLSAMFEYMVVVQDTSPLLLTETRDWEIIV